MTKQKKTTFLPDWGQGKGLGKIIFCVIFLLGLFFRTYQIESRLEFAHDGDLYSWIVKDVVVDHHIRLIGQLTSAPGIFIGPLFYYSLVLFFLLFRMDPLAGVVPITILGMVTIISYYWVFSKLFNKTVGLIGAFLQAVLLSPVYFDRAVVPSTPTNLWIIWYFYCVIKLTRGDYSVLWVLGILIGLIWHIHIALLPALIAIPIAFILSKKLPTFARVRNFILTLSLTSLPLVTFEIRHNFSQTKSLYVNFFQNHGTEQAGIEKINLVLIYIGHNLERLFFYPNAAHLKSEIIAFIFIIIPTLWAVFRFIKIREAVVLLSWIVGIILFYGFSSSQISEYYFTNIEVVAIALVSVLLAYVYHWKTAGKLAVVGLLCILLVKNMSFFIHEQHFQKGYTERKAVTEFIVRDMTEKEFPCIALSYITGPGDNVGFRYLFWLYGIKTKHPQDNVPVYTVVYPKDFIDAKGRALFGQFRVLGPDNVATPEEIAKNCEGEDKNLTDPVFGFTK